MTQPDNMSPEWKVPPCNDQGCDQRAQCMCWGVTDDPKWFGFSLFPYDTPINDPCPHFADREAA